jgi:hypothetical protein
MSLGGAFSIIGVGPQGVYKAKAGGGAPANTARTQAFLTASGITDPQIINALNQMDLSLISAGLLPAGTGAGKIKALYPIVGGTAATHKFNFVDPRDLDAAYRLVFFGGWTHSANGALPNGTNGYADTFLNQNTLNQNSQHISAYVRQDANSGGSASIGINASLTFLLIRTNAVYGNVNDGDFSLSTNSLKGFFLSTRTASNIRRTFRNLVNTISSAVSSTANANLTFYISALNNGGSPAFFDNLQTAANSIGEGLTITESNNFYNTIQAFQTTLGRQV